MQNGIAAGQKAQHFMIHIIPRKEGDGLNFELPKKELSEAELESIRKKLEASLDAGLIPVLCVGETQKDKEEGKTQYRLKEQLMEALAGLDASADKIIFAYEPVWAIGTDNPCLPADAEDIHGWIKKEVKNYLEGEAKVIYGGSVKAENVASFISRDTIDGVLVGIASTKIDSFLAIIKAVKNQ